MLRNYFKIAARNLLRNRLHSFILIFGLGIGMAACLLLLEYVSFEWSYDQFHKNADRIYRVVNTRYQNGDLIQRGTITYPTIGPTMKKDFPEVEQYTRMTISNRILLQQEDQMIQVDQPLVVDQHFFNLFSASFLAGDQITALQETNNIALSRSTVERLFSNTISNYDQLIGKMIQVDDYDAPFKISLIYEDFPDNSLLQAGALLSYASIINYWGEGSDNSWEWSDFYHFLLLSPTADQKQLEAKFAQFSSQYFDESATGIKEVFELQPLLDAHLKSTDLEYEIGQTANGKSIWALLIIGLIILIIAWVNYINLSSVKAIERAKEVGVRKVIGAEKKQILFQFLMEAFLINGISLVLALAVLQIAQPLLSQLLEINLSLSHLFQIQNNSLQLLALLGMLIILGMLSAAFYPAWLLGKQNVSNVLKGLYKKSSASVFLRRTLVVFQFTASIVLIICTLMIYQQLKHMSDQDLGIDVDQILVLDGPELSNFDSTFIDRLNTFKSTLTQFPNIESATMTSRLPGQRTGRLFQLRTSSDESATSYTTSFINTDYNYPQTFDLPLLAGRYLRITDHNLSGRMIDKILVNESAYKMLGFKTAEEIVDQKIYIRDREWTVVGVLPDFHQRSLHHPIEPMLFNPFLSPGNPLAIKMNPKNIDKTITQVRSTFDQFFPNNNFAYHFLDERFQEQYNREERFGKILIFFTLLTILIACLGLFGLASYTAFLRTKEIGIRKVLGSSTSDIVLLLSKDFLKLVFIAILLAIPLAWRLSIEWLAGFHYSINLHWTTYALAGCLVLLISFLTIGYQSLKTAIMNPINALRNE